MMSTQYLTSYHTMGNGPPASNVRYKAQNRPGGIHNSTVNNQHCSSFLTEKMTVMTVLVLFLVAKFSSLVQVFIYRKLYYITKNI